MKDRCLPDGSELPRVMGTLKYLHSSQRSLSEFSQVTLGQLLWVYVICPNFQYYPYYLLTLQTIHKYCRQPSNRKSSFHIYKCAFPSRVKNCTTQWSHLVTYWYYEDTSSMFLDNFSNYWKLLKTVENNTAWFSIPL